MLTWQVEYAQMQCRVKWSSSLGGDAFAAFAALYECSRWPPPYLVSVVFQTLGAVKREGLQPTQTIRSQIASCQLAGGVAGGRWHRTPQLHRPGLSGSSCTLCKSQISEWGEDRQTLDLGDIWRSRFEKHTGTTRALPSYKSSVPTKRQRPRRPAVALFLVCSPTSRTSASYIHVVYTRCKIPCSTSAS